MRYLSLILSLTLIGLNYETALATCRPYISKKFSDDSVRQKYLNLVNETVSLIVNNKQTKFSATGSAYFLNGGKDVPWPFEPHLSENSIFSGDKVSLTTTTRTSCSPPGYSTSFADYDVYKVDVISEVTIDTSAVPQLQFECQLKFGKLVSPLYVYPNNFLPTYSFNSKGCPVIFQQVEKALEHVSAGVDKIKYKWLALPQVQPLMIPEVVFDQGSRSVSFDINSFPSDALFEKPVHYPTALSLLVSSKDPSSSCYIQKPVQQNPSDDYKAYSQEIQRIYGANNCTIIVYSSKEGVFSAISIEQVSDMKAKIKIDYSAIESINNKFTGTNKDLLSLVLNHPEEYQFQFMLDFPNSDAPLTSQFFLSVPLNFHTRYYSQEFSSVKLQ